MHIEEFRDYCLAKPFVTEGFPFDEYVLVFKVGGKIFALTNVEKFESINLKCDPEYAVELRESYEAVEPGYHMSKKHWNTVRNSMDVDDPLLKELIDQSYELVYKSLTKKVRDGLQNG